MAGLLQDDGGNDKSTLVLGMPITQRRLGFDDDEGSDTRNRTRGGVGGYMKADKDCGKAGTPRLERLLQLKVLLISQSSAGLVTFISFTSL